MRHFALDWAFLHFTDFKKRKYRVIPCCGHYVQILKLIIILNPSLDVKMFIKGVQTYLESLFSVPFVPNKKMLWLALKTLKV